MDKETILAAAKHCTTENRLCVDCPMVDTHYCRKFLLKALVGMVESEGNPLLTRYKPEEKLEEVTRSYILDRAKEIVNGQRNGDYGEPEYNFARIARLWSDYLGCEIEAEDVPALMILLKVGRIESGSQSVDNWVDIAGYAACGGEIANVER